MIPIRKSRAASTDRKPPGAGTESKATVAALPAPVAGWVEAPALTVENALWVGENAFPTTRGLRIRGGSYRVADIGEPVTSLFKYKSATVDKIFAASDGSIYDVSAFDPDTIPTADVTGQTSGVYSTAHMGTVGGEYIYAVNGTDSALLFDGSTWEVVTDVSTIAITGVDTDALRYAWTHKNRFWFIEAGTSTAWYLPVDSVGGAAADFSLAGVFQLGGELLFGATWSEDSGSGMDDRIVFVSINGEVAVFQGTDPANAASWAQVGVYRMSRPLGQDAFIRAGGDVLIATDSGLVSLSAVTQKDPAALSVSSVSSHIELTWRNNAQGYVSTKPWQVTKWDSEGLAFVSIPTASSEALVVNVNTGAWSKCVGWDMQAVCTYSEGLYFGTVDGYIYQAERGGTDDGAAYLSRWAYAPQQLGAGSSRKVVSMMRSTWAATTEFAPQLSMEADYNLSFPSPPGPASDPETVAAYWDVGEWDVSTWDGGTGNPANAPISSTGWVSIGQSGYSVTPQFQVLTMSVNRPNVEFLGCEILFEVGAPIG